MRLCWVTLRDRISFKVFFLQYTTESSFCGKKYQTPPDLVVNRGTSASWKVVYLPTADKYCRLTHQSSKGQKGLCEGLSWHPSVPLPPGGALEAGRVDARRLLRPPPLAASHHSACSHPCWLRPGRHTEEQHLAQRPDVIGQPRGHGRRLGLPAFG